MNERWLCEQLNNLNMHENRMSALSEIHVRLNESTNTQLEALVTNRLLSAPEIYDCLQECSGSHEEWELVTDILSICMSNLRINQNDLPMLLDRALTHPQTRVRALAFNTILKELQREKNENQSTYISDELLMHVLNGLCDENTEVGVPAVNILSIVLESRLDQVEIIEKLKDMLSGSENIKCRVYELSVNLAKQSPASLQKVEFLLDRSLSELDNDDVLFQVNILEILVSLAEQNHGLLYLEKMQVFEILSRRVEMMHQNPLDRLLIPGIMRFFGKAASVQPQKVIAGYPHMMHCLFESILSGNVAILPAAFDTMANLAQSNKGKLLLEKNYSAMFKETFEEIAAHLQNLPSNLKNRAFNTLEKIFTTEGNIPVEIQELLQKWFTYLSGGANMQFLMDFCRNPFPDIKVACLGFIKSVCTHRWGIVMLRDTAGFVEYLLDRKIEFDKEAKYAKYELIRLLADSDIFDVQTNIQLRTYANEGPYFVQSMMDIATEGN